ncbi:MAG: rRNA maturation RNase YbeY [Candidatus Ancillula sp.]|jgi:probable rRNA maturation factor|nr:rRNA maturation RNase YbeY [Candidatus Ancillula sp.]
MSVEVVNETDFGAIDEAEFVALAYFLYDQMNIDHLADLSIVFHDEDSMAKLHKDWMGLDGPTDVMSFPIDEIKPGCMPRRPDTELDLCLGDIVICPTVAAKQATASKHTAQEEMLLLATHGFLHLLGYDHIEEAEKKEMFDLQRKLLLKFIANRGNVVVETLEIKGLP